MDSFTRYVFLALFVLLVLVLIPKSSSTESQPVAIGTWYFGGSHTDNPPTWDSSGKLKKGGNQLWDYGTISEGVMEPFTYEIFSKLDSTIATESTPILFAIGAQLDAETEDPYTDYLGIGAYGRAIAVSFEGPDKKTVSLRLVVDQMDGADEHKFTLTDPVLDTWVHTALVRDATSFKLYINGSLKGSVNSTLAIEPFISGEIANGDGANEYTLVLGNVPSLGYTNSDFLFKGYMSNFRVSDGAIYTGSTFSVPSLPLTIQEGFTRGLYIAETSNTWLEEYGPGTKDLSANDSENLSLNGVEWREVMY